MLLAVLANDSSPNGALVAGSVQVVNQPAHGFALAARERYVEISSANTSGSQPSGVAADADGLLLRPRPKSNSLFANGWNGTPDRALLSWVVSAPAGTEVTISAISDRTGRISATVLLS